MATKNDPLYTCVCKTYNNELKQNMDEIKSYIIMEMEHKPKLVRRISEIVSNTVQNEIFKAIQILNKEIEEIGYEKIVPSSELGCTADDHHCLCDK